jgi:type 1 glutamine amidotransferase
VTNAVASGVGLAGCHGGICDAFRNDTDWQFMTGGQFVAHPGNDGVRYRVDVGASGGHALHWATDGVADFVVESEQYYMHIDPAVTVLASTLVPPDETPDTAANRERFPGLFGPHVPNGRVRMPVVWTKHWGAGRVYYCSLGHSAAVLSMPPVRRLITRGMLWAAQADA